MAAWVAEVLQAALVVVVVWVVAMEASAAVLAAVEVVVKA